MGFWGFGVVVVVVVVVVGSVLTVVVLFVVVGVVDTVGHQVNSVVVLTLKIEYNQVKSLSSFN